LFWLDSGLRKLDDFIGTVYRGITNLKKIGIVNEAQSTALRAKKIVKENYTIGREICWSSYTSTTESLEVAKNYAGSHWIIFVISNASGKAIKKYSPRRSEKEVILFPDTCLSVVGPGFYELDGCCYVHLMQMPRNIDILNF
jgi:hypothetical protein